MWSETGLAALDIGFNITITILDIIHCPAFYLKRNVSETKGLFPPEWVPPENGERTQSPKRCILNERQDDG
jgi:hypothetical protein